MVKRLSKILFFVLGVFLLSSSLYADDITQSENDYYQDQTKLVSQQNELLKNRISQAQIELQTLQKQQETFNAMSFKMVNSRLLNQSSLDIGVKKSNVDSINIELTECQQTIARLEKDVEDIQRQLNAFNVFGLKVARNGSSDLEHLHHEMDYQSGLLTLEKKRSAYLIQLQKLSDSVLQVNKAKYAHIDNMLKSQTLMQLKERQAKSEIGFQQQQTAWSQELIRLDAELTQLQGAKTPDKNAYDQLQNEIFYVNENVNFTYLQMLIARYQGQIQQLKLSISRGNSISILNKTTSEAQDLGKQLSRVDRLLKVRMDILLKHKNLFGAEGQPGSESQYAGLQDQYQDVEARVTELNTELVALRTSLDQALQRELSARQGLPGFGAKAWVDLGGEILLVPNLTFQVFKSLGTNVLKALATIGIFDLFLLAILQTVWVFAFFILNYFLKKLVARLPDHESGHINLKWLAIKLLHRSLWDIALIGNFLWVLSYCGIPLPNFIILVNLAMVWLIFKSIIMMARLCLVETVHDRAGHDVRLYHQLKRIFLFGGVITALTVFMHQLPVIYEVIDLFDRLFLLFLLIASVFLLRQWQLLPNLILPHIDERRTYLRGVVRLLGILIPLVLLVNSVIGLLGYVNLIMTFSWYESIFIFVLVGYLLLRGLLNDAMDLVSMVLIRHVTNGWLWTEAVLKPIDRVLRIGLFLAAWVVLFLWYGWDQQSPVVERFTKLLSYHLVDVLNTAITPLSMIELTVIVSLLYWAARWTREFVYRLLLSRTKDLGLRNSLAIMSQYAMIVVGVFVGLRLLGIDFRALTVVATAFAFGVGLGLRDLVNNFVCGFLLLIERPLRVGDIVSFNGYEGEVTHIGGRAVTLRTWDHMEVLVPNAEIFSKSFTNWTAKDSIVRTVIQLKVTRNDKPQDVQKMIHHVLADHKDVLTDPAPEVFLKEMTDGLVEFEVRYYLNIRQVKSRIGLRSEVLVGIWEAFEKHGIKSPYSQHEIVMKGSEATHTLQTNEKN